VLVWILSFYDKNDSVQTRLVPEGGEQSQSQSRNITRDTFSNVLFSLCCQKPRYT
jgi:hypothetical protein